MSKNLHVFLGFLLISLVGNSCADFAILWLGAKIIGVATFSGIELLSAFYVGQALGHIFVAPLLGVKIDKMSKLFSSILIDSLQIITYLLLILCFQYDLMNYFIIIIFSILMGSLSSLHRNGVTFSVLNKLSDHINVELITKKFTYVFNFTLLFGVLASGICFRFLGFKGCLYLAIGTFLPMFFVYWKLFANEKKNVKLKIAKSSFFEGYVKLFNEKRILHTVIAVMFTFMPGAIYPGIVTIFLAKDPYLSNYLSYFIGLGILVGTLFIPVASKLIKTVKISNSFFIGFFPLVVSMVVYLFYPSNWLMGFSFALNCIGFSFSNIFTFQLRLKLINKDDISSVNTSYYAIMSIGQVIGALLLLPYIKINPGFSVVAILMSFSIAIIYAYFYCPKKLLSEL